MAHRSEDHLAFGRTLSRELAGGKPLLSCLALIRRRLASTEFAPVIESLVEDIASGATFSEAIAAHGSSFTACEQALTRAAEVGRVLDVVAGRIADGIEEGSLPLPGEGPAKDDPERWWRAFARLLSSGVPLPRTLDLLALEVAGPRLAEAARTVGRAILEGAEIEPALALRPDCFPAEVRIAAAAGALTGDLDRTALAIAEALAAGDLRCLVPDGSAGGGGRTDPADSTRAAEMLDRIISEGIRARASDIHIDPLEEGGLGIRNRVDGVLTETEAPPPDLAKAILAQLKIMARMDVAERRLPQDSRTAFEIAEKRYDIHVSVAPTALGERVVLRILDRGAQRFDLESLGLGSGDLEMVRKLARLPNGIVICNGPTGSGKTTLLYALLTEIDRGTCCVMSVEDPVEVRLEGVAQIQVDPRIGLTFPRALRSVMRQDPDVVMIGEIRDLETLAGAIECALTGHLVFTTLHSDSSPGAVRRLLDIGTESFLVNSALAGVISQRLVRVLCPECRQAAPPDLNSVPPAAAEFIRSRPEATFQAPRGCDACRGTGYRRRTAIHEVLVPGERVRQAVAAGADVASIRDAALADGMRPMLLSGLEKAALGITSITEVCRVMPQDTRG